MVYSIEYMKITINRPKVPIDPTLPYWATNDSGDLFYITDREMDGDYGYGVVIRQASWWKSTQRLALNMLKPLPPGTKIEITVE